ncbi:nucleotide exchange factor GrpE [Raoultibacter phocaeensis]|uniref:nucleotide exchange factor GrpE n=1 Tax=Raoultibacter phocaeensis TaxID=2479841 RepID=UPI0021047F81|nr:nucleotide exchange factor GrpE [Raoultibacter phocaeensis]
MAMPDKDKVTGTSRPHANPGGSPFPHTPPSGAAANDETRQAAGSKEPAADGKASSTSGGADKASNAEQDAQAVEAEVLDPESDGSEAAIESELVAQAQAEAAEWQDKFVRLHAEWDTYRRRTAEQRATEKARANEKLVESLLPVIDDFERTIDYAQKNGETGLLGGVEAVHAKLVDTLVKDGVIILDPKGEAFDALEAQAVATVDDTSVPDETVADVYQKGFKMGNKVLRPAMVTVTTGGPKREAPKETEEKK